MAGDLIATAKRYVEELKNSFEKTKEIAMSKVDDVKGTVQKIQNFIKDAQAQLKPKIESTKEELKRMVEDKTPVQPEEHKRLMEGYMWTAICLFAFSIAQIIGGLLSPLLGFIFVTFLGTTGIAFILLPAYLYMYQKKTQMKGNERRFFNLVGAIALGVAGGFQFAALHLQEYAPPAFMCCLGVSIAAGALKLPARTAFLGACAGISVGLYFLFGMVLGMGFGYMLWMLIYIAITAADVQIKIGKLRQGAIMQTEQMLTIIIFADLYALMYMIHGTPPGEDAPPPKKD